MSLLFKLNMIRGVIVDEDENEVEATVPVTIAAAHVRSFNPRKDEKVGTRLTFVNGRGFAVTETYEQVTGLFAGN